MTKPLYIFDLDGTIANCDHRQHLVHKNPPDWPGFYQACDMDKPNWPVINTLHRLMMAGSDVRIWSARGSEVREKTVQWLMKYLGLGRERIEAMLTMRPENNTEPDDVIKQRWLFALNPLERELLTAIFDDRDKVVAMWRRNGVACFQVAPGNF